MLTERANRYLRTLQRETPLPISAIEKRLLDQGIPAFPAWLAFHEEFAGYWEDLGHGDVAVWGLARKDSAWCGSEEISVYLHRSKPIYIACADAHPSHGFDLKPDGTFLGVGMKSFCFATKVERTALYWDFALSGNSTLLYSGTRFPDEERALLLEEMGPHLIEEASDEYANYYRSATRLVVEGLAQPHIEVLSR